MTDDSESQSSIERAFGPERAKQIAQEWYPMGQNEICIPKNDNVLNILGMDGFETRIEGNTIYLSPKWIKCADQQPKEMEQILMTYNRLVLPGWFSKGKFYYITTDTLEVQEQEGITHWMLLPEPPNE